MFEWYWFFVFYLFSLHVKLAVHTIYVHRTIAHGMFIVSKPLDYVFRFILWTGGSIGPKWAERYAVQHRRHHVISDTPEDRISPHHYTLKEIIEYYKSLTSVSEEDIKKYCPDVATNNDWMQTVMIEKYRHLGPWFWHILALILCGPVGLILSVVIRHLTKEWLGVYLGNYVNHKYGFEYAERRHPTDKSKNIVPWGLFMAGEELHTNHHNNSFTPSFARYWFEIDLGYVYAKILSYMGLLKIKKEMK